MRTTQVIKGLVATVGVAAVSSVVSSCSEGSGLKLSEVDYEPVAVAEVRVSTTYPKRYESVGLVEASAEHMFKGNNGVAELALDELKKQAAEMGANMVVVKNLSADPSVDGIIIDSNDDWGALLGQTNRRRLSGEAIRVW